MPYTFASILDLSNRVAVVTGAGAHVVMAVRDQAKAADGFEMQLGVNHLGHWALTARLMPAVLRAESARVVTVTSTARHLGRALQADNPHLHGRYKPWRAYGQSKPANWHFALGLQREFDRVGIAAKSLVAHPGLTNSDLQARSVREGGGGAAAGFFHRLTGLTSMTPDRSALPQIRAATDPAARGGQLYAPRFVNSGAAVRRPVLRRGGLSRAIATLWAVSERETGLALDVYA